MKKVLSVLVITCVIVAISPLANAAINLTQLDSKTAAVLSDDGMPPGGFLSIPSTIDYIINPEPPIIVGPAEDWGDDLDWIPIINASPVPIPAGTILTLTLTGPEIFAIGPYDLNLWDETATGLIGSISIVPEPATLGLLGLGGLLIRKRK